jgi:hypothetical protein
MPKNKNFIPLKLRPWIEARKKFRLTHAKVQMARELGMNPKRLDSLNNHDQEPWKLPLPQFIEHCYQQQFGKSSPDDVRSIGEKIRTQREKKDAKRQAKAEFSLEF